VIPVIKRRRSHERISEGRHATWCMRRRAASTMHTASRLKMESTGELIHVDTRKLGRILQLGHRVTGNPRVP